MTVSSSSNETRRLIAMDQGIDSELGIVGLGYSPDNGLHFFVTNTIKGRVFRQEDADHLWPYLKDFVTAQLAAVRVDWADIQNIPTDLIHDSDLEIVKNDVAKAQNTADDALSQAQANAKSLSTKADKSELPTMPDLTPYALKTEIPSLKGYAKLTDIPSVTDFIKRVELADYAKKSDIPTSMSWNSITGKPDIATKSDIPDVSKLAQKLDDSDWNTVKKPSEYSEGFSYEVKWVPYFVDRSGYDTTIQQGNTGILTTIKYGQDARQILRIINSKRPLTFERNGTGPNWYEWELITTW